VIEACFGTAEAFYRPAFTGLVPQTVPEDEIQPARAAFSTLETIAEFAGPALATVLVLGVGPGYAFALDAATFLVSAAFLVRLRPRPRGEPGVRTTILAELREGWSEVRSRMWIWVIVAVFSLGLLTAFGPWMTLGAAISMEHYDTTPSARRSRSWCRRSSSPASASPCSTSGGTPRSPSVCRRTCSRA
jgi:Major Facilitator Superfamily